jgi:hypothetical protein
MNRSESESGSKSELESVDQLSEERLQIIESILIDNCRRAYKRMDDYNDNHGFTNYEHFIEHNKQCVKNLSKKCNDKKYEISVTKYLYDYKLGTQVIDSIQIFEIVQKWNICISPSALMEICDMFGKKINKQFYKTYNTITGSTMLFTSTDLIALRVSGNIDKFVKVEPMIKFTDDPINNLIMLLCLNVPIEDDVPKVIEHLDQYKYKSAIKEYFDNYYKYNLESISW